VVTEWIRGKSVEDVVKIKNSEIAKHLSLPPVKLHCSMLAEDAIKVWGCLCTCMRAWVWSCLCVHACEQARACVSAIKSNILEFDCSLPADESLDLRA